MPKTTTAPIETFFPTLRPDDGKPHLFHGSAASLQPLRTFIQTTKKQIDVDDIQQPLTTTDQHEKEEEEEEDDETTSQEEQLILHIHSTCINMTLPFLIRNDGGVTTIQGQVFITTKRVFLVAHEESDAKYDVAMNAYCISLHALMSEPTRSLYCQLSEDVEIHGDATAADDNFDNEDDNNDDDEMGASKEVTIEPINAGDGQAACQELFDALSKLMNLNPMPEEDDENGFGSSGAGGGLAAMLGLMANAYGGDEEYDHEDDDDDDMICRIDPSQMMTAESLRNGDGDGAAGGGASASERQKMLERLDNVLVVPPEYEMEGQFDDADEEQLDSSDEKIL